jgi:hypothetical protein
MAMPCTGAKRLQSFTSVQKVCGYTIPSTKACRNWNGLECPPIVSTDVNGFRLLGEWHEVRNSHKGRLLSIQMLTVQQLSDFAPVSGLTSCHSGLCPRIPPTEIPRFSPRLPLNLIRNFGFVPQPLGYAFRRERQLERYL